MYIRNHDSSLVTIWSWFIIHIRRNYMIITSVLNILHVLNTSTTRLNGDTPAGPALCGWHPGPTTSWTAAPTTKTFLMENKGWVFLHKSHGNDCFVDSSCPASWSENEGHPKIKNELDQIEAFSGQIVAMTTWRKKLDIEHDQFLWMVFLRFLSNHSDSSSFSCLFARLESQDFSESC